MRPTVIFCSSQLQSLWPSTLPRQWASFYPELFDEDDLRLAMSQPRYHFNEWLAAVHLFHRDGAFSLVEKYAFETHPRKRGVLRVIFNSEQIQVLRQIRQELRSQLPDLLVFTPDHQRVWFAEVKGPGDRIHSAQVSSHAAIRERLGLEVELIVVRLSDQCGTEEGMARTRI